jgi:hypothetical protein
MRARTAAAKTTLHIRPSDLRPAPPKRLDADQFVAQLGSTGLGGVSYVVGRRDPEPPEWIALGYATDAHERVWRRGGRPADGVVAYLLVEDDSSNGYVSVA